MDAPSRVNDKASADHVCGCWSLDHAVPRVSLHWSASAVGVSALVLAFRSGLQWPTRRISPRRRAVQACSLRSHFALREKAGLDSVHRSALWFPRRPPTACRKVPRCHITPAALTASVPRSLRCGSRCRLRVRIETRSRRRPYSPRRESLGSELASELAHGISASGSQLCASWPARTRHLSPHGQRSLRLLGRWLAAPRWPWLAFWLRPQARSGRCRALGPCCQWRAPGCRAVREGRWCQ